MVGRGGREGGEGEKGAGENGGEKRRKGGSGEAAGWQGSMEEEAGYLSSKQFCKKTKWIIMKPNRIV